MPASGQMGEMGDAAGQQEALRRMLGEMMRRLGEGSGRDPGTVRPGRAGDARCGRRARRRRPGEAIGPQTEALDQLQQAARDFAQQIQKQLGNGLGKPDGEVGATDRAGATGRARPARPADLE